MCSDDESDGDQSEKDEAVSSHAVLVLTVDEKRRTQINPHGIARGVS